MKKFLAMVMACLMLFSLVACSNGDKDKENNEKPGKVEVVNPTEGNGETTPDDNNNETSNPTDPSKPSGGEEDPNETEEDYFTVLNEDTVVYDKNGIKVTFVNAEFGVGLSDEYSFKVENNSSKDVLFSVMTAMLDGHTFVCTDAGEGVLAGETKTVIASVFVNDRKEFFDELAEIKCLQFEAFIVENPKGEYGSYGDVIEKCINIDLTQGTHNHKKHAIVQNGELVYENEYIALYVDVNADKAAFSDSFPFTIVNKTDKQIAFDFTDAEYKTVDITEFYQPTSVMGSDKTVSPYGFVTGSFRLYDTKFDAIKEMKLTMKCTNATYLNSLIGDSGNYNLPFTGEVLTINVR